MYFDIANIERYDVIMGTLFMKQHRGALDFTNNEVIIGSQQLPNLFHADTPTATNWHRAAVKHKAIWAPTKTTSTTVEPTGSRWAEPTKWLHGYYTEPAEGKPAHMDWTRAKWKRLFELLMCEPPPELPPLRDINQNIKFMDEEKKISYSRACCPEALKAQLLEKILTYICANWWYKGVAEDAPLMLCLFRKDKEKLHTVINLRKWNNNTVKDLTPFPDQDEIRQAVAWGKYQSKLDMTSAYDQIHIHPDHVSKTAFQTVYSMLYSNVMHQGDCNAPSTFQRLMTRLFCSHIGWGIYMYLNNIFVYSDTTEEHKHLLGEVLRILTDTQLYLSEWKVEFLAERIDCLGQIIDKHGIHTHTDKMSAICNWPMPRTVLDIQRFLGLVQYLATYMLDLSAYTTSISLLTWKRCPFIWMPLHNHCFNVIKGLACQAPILWPINTAMSEPIWLITDASVASIGCMYGQGPDWQSVRPAGFHSRKFSPAQMNYRTHKQELLGILEGLMKWEDKLLGCSFHVLTDHQSLQWLKTQPELSRQQVRWLEHLPRFNFEIEYIPSDTNVVANALLHRYKNDEPRDIWALHEFVNADAQLDPKGEEAPGIPANAAHAGNTPRRSCQLQEKQEQRTVEASALRTSETTLTTVYPPAAGSGECQAWLADDPQVANGRDEAPPPVGEDLLNSIHAVYTRDDKFGCIIANMGQHPDFTQHEGLQYFSHRQLLCVPKARLKTRCMTEIVIDTAHIMLGHMGHQHTLAYLHQWYWWPTMARGVDKFCKSCGACQMTKPLTQQPQGLLHSLPIPNRPWGSIGMDFLGQFPESNRFNYLLVVLCQLTSMIHLIPTQTTIQASEVTTLMAREVIHLHRLPDSIVSDQDTKFTSTMWRELHCVLGIKLLMSTVFHPQTDGVVERANLTVAQILHTLVTSDQQDWVQQLPAVELAINSSISASTGFALFKLNYGWISHLISAPAANTPYKGVQQWVERATEDLEHTFDAIIMSCVTQCEQANSHWQADDPLLEIG
jgi:hypothetical protein